MNPQTLEKGEQHPASLEAMQYIFNYSQEDLIRYHSMFKEMAESGNRLGQICAETLRRIFNEEVITDKYVLGLAWAIRSIEMERNKDIPGFTKV